MKGTEKKGYAGDISIKGNISAKVSTISVPFSRTYPVGDLFTTFKLPSRPNSVSMFLSSSTVYGPSVRFAVSYLSKLAFYKAFALYADL